MWPPIGFKAPPATNVIVAPGSAECQSVWFNTLLVPGRKWTHTVPGWLRGWQSVRRISKLRDDEIKQWTLYSSDSFVSLDSIWRTGNKVSIWDLWFLWSRIQTCASWKKRLILVLSFEICVTYLLLSFAEFASTWIIHAEKGHDTIYDLYGIGKTSDLQIPNARAH